MNKKKPNFANHDENKTNSDQSVNKDLPTSINDQRSLDFRSSISKLSYEEALETLDSILDNLQRDNVQVEDLQTYYLKGKFCLEHCLKLLDKIDQEVLQMDLETFGEDKEN